MTTRDEHTTDEEPWDELTDELLALTARLRSVYRQAAQDQGPTEEEVRQAIGTLAAASKQMAGSIGAALADPLARDHLKRAAGSLVDAAAAALGELRARPDHEDREAEEQ